MAELFAQQDLLKSVTKEDIDAFVRPMKWVVDDDWRPDRWCAAQQIPMCVFEECVKAVGDSFPNWSDAIPNSVRPAAAAIHLLAKKFSADDIRHHWFNDLADLLDQQADFTAHAQANLAIEWPTQFDPPATLRAKVNDYRTQLPKLDDQYVRQWLINLIAGAELRADGLENGLITLAKPEYTELEKKQWQSMPVCENISSAEFDETLPDQTNGPFGRNGFRWGMLRPRTGLTPTPFRLLTALWTAKDRTASFRELAVAVWDDCEINLRNDSRLGSARRAVNGFMEKGEFPFRVETSPKVEKVTLVESTERPATPRN